MSRLDRLLPYAPLLALGPVTGPLLGLALHYARKGQWLRSGACIAGIAAFYILVPALLAWLIAFDLHAINGGRS